MHSTTLGSTFPDCFRVVELPDCVVIFIPSALELFTEWVILCSTIGFFVSLLCLCDCCVRFTGALLSDSSNANITRVKSIGIKVQWLQWLCKTYSSVYEKDDLSRNKFVRKGKQLNVCLYVCVRERKSFTEKTGHCTV